MTISDINIDYNITCIKLLVCGHRVNRILQYIIHFTFCITPWSLLGNRSSALRDFCHSLYNMKKIIPSSNQNSKKCQNLTCAQNTMLTQGIQKVSVKDTDSGHTQHTKQEIQRQCLLQSLCILFSHRMLQTERRWDFRKLGKLVMSKLCSRLPRGNIVSQLYWDWNRFTRKCQCCLLYITLEKQLILLAQVLGLWELNNKL